MKRKNKSTVGTTSTIAKYLAIIISSIGILVIICLGLLFFWLTNPYLLCFKTVFPSNLHVENLAKIQFPNSVTNITYEFEETGAIAAPTCTIWLQFEMDSQDFDLFTETTLIEQFENTKLESENSFDYRMEKMNWSQPENSLAGYGYIPCCSPEISQWIFIDTNDPNIWIVYVLTNEYWLD